MDRKPSAHRVPVTAEEALRNRWGVASVKRPPVADALVDTTNLPSKRQRLSNRDDDDHDDKHRAMANANRGRKTLYMAPDWGGGETASAATPFGGRSGESLTQFSGRGGESQTQFSGRGGESLTQLLVPPASTPASYRDTSNPLSLSHPKWGLKREVVMGFASCGIAEMYPWQSECLSLPGLLSGEKNLVYTAPTSAGKSLVADVLAIRKVIAERKKAIIVVPYVAIVQEKTKFLKTVLEKVRVMADSRGTWDKQKRWRSINVVGFHSGAKARIGWEELDLAVCTIEKVRIHM